MKKPLIIGAALAAFTVTGPVAIADTGSGTAAPARTCKLKALESVKIRKTMNINATALGLFPKGKTAKSGCITRDGGEYKRCGRSWPTWRWVDYPGVPRGWVPYACVKPV
ncbi:hypothetical protein [Actinomadura sp. 6N118]|uniref:hypothetical protein n=1 Tax=Actinomadura sp. 6N118 TaxID=3375151 RepID=UPI0037B9CA4E